MRRFLLLMACGAIAAAQTRAQSRSGITAEDYFSFEFLSDPQLSPDGEWVAYTVATIDQKANKRVSRIWIVPADGSQPPTLFAGETASSTSPRWSPDGRSLSFLSARRRPPANLAAAAHRRRGAARIERRKRRVKLRMVARWDALRLPDAHRSAGEQNQRCAALHAHLL